MRAEPREGKDKGLILAALPSSNVAVTVARVRSGFGSLEEKSLLSLLPPEDVGLGGTMPTSSVCLCPPSTFDFTSAKPRFP